MLTFSKKTHHSFIIFLALIAGKLAPLTQQEVYDFHHAMQPEGDHASILYGYCALETRLVTDFCAFAPDSTGIARLTRLLFYIQPWDGETVATGNPVSAVPQITPQMWAKIVTLLSNLTPSKGEQSSSPKEVQQKIKALISDGLGWENQITEGEKKIDLIIKNDPIASKIKQEIETLNTEKEKLTTKGASVQEKEINRKRLNEIAPAAKILERDLKNRMEAFSKETKEEIKRAQRDEKSPQKIAQALIDATLECTNQNPIKNIFPANLVYTIITAYIVKKFALADIKEYLLALPKNFFDVSKYIPKPLVRVTATLSKEDAEKLYTTDLARIAFSLLPKIAVPVVPYLTNVPFAGTEFSDCVETALLNMINQLGFSPETEQFSLNFLQSKKDVVLHPKLIKYYKNFPTPSEQMAPSAHTAFEEILAGNPNIAFTKEAKFDLDSPANNVLKALGYLIFYDGDYPDDADTVLKKLKVFGDAQLLNNRIIQVTMQKPFRIECDANHAQYFPPTSGDALTHILCLPERFATHPSEALEQLLTAYIPLILKQETHTYCFDLLSNKEKYGIRFELTRQICHEFYKKEHLFFAKNNPEILMYLPIIMQRWAFSNPNYRDEQSQAYIIAKLVRDWSSDKNLSRIMTIPYGTTSLLESYIRRGNPEEIFGEFLNTAKKGAGCALIAAKEANAEQIILRAIGTALETGSFFQHAKREMAPLTYTQKSLCIAIPEKVYRMILLHTELGTFTMLAEIVSKSKQSLLSADFRIGNQAIPKTKSLFDTIKSQDTARILSTLQKYLAEESLEQREYRRALTKGRDQKSTTIIKELEQEWPHKNIDAFAYTTTVAIYGGLLDHEEVEQLVADGFPRDVISEIAPNPAKPVE